MGEGGDRSPLPLDDQTSSSLNRGEASLTLVRRRHQSRHRPWLRQQAVILWVPRLTTAFLNAAVGQRGLRLHDLDRRAARAAAVMAAGLQAHSRESRREDRQQGA